MRCVAGAGLLALVGCNQVFGLSKTREYDAAPDVDPDMPYVRLTWQVATQTRAGLPDPVIAYLPIAPAPDLRIAPLDTALADSLDRVTYSQTDGVVAIPKRYFGRPWRLEYRRAGEPPHELQWNPDDKVGLVVIPVFGRLDRDPVPTGGGYTATPSNPPAGYGFPRVFTTGLWTEGVAAIPTGAAVDFDFFNAVSLSGPKGRPDPILGDRAFVVDFTVDGGSTCTIASGSAALPSAAIQAGAHSPEAVLWDSGRKTVASTPINVTAPLTRLVSALGGLDGRQGYTGTLLFGVGASESMPGLTALPATRLLSAPAFLPVPMMVTLLQCPYSIPPPSAAQPAALDAFPHLLHLQISNARTVDAIPGLSLISGIETVALAAGNQLDVRFPAAFPTRMTLTTSLQQVVDLVGPADHVSIGPPQGAFTLAFVPEIATPGEALRVDYYDVLLHRISGGALTTERIYTVTAPSVRIDGAVLAPASEYVFEVRSYKGHPKAPRGDFSAVDYPYGATIIYTRTFRTT